MLCSNSDNVVNTDLCLKMDLSPVFPPPPPPQETLEFENCYKQKYLKAESYKIVLITVPLNGNPKPSRPLPGEGLTHTCFSGEGGGGGRFALPWYDVFTNNRQYREDLIIIVNRSPLKQF